MKVIFSQSQINEIINFYKNKNSILSIAKSFNHTAKVIHRVLSENNIPIRKTGKGTSPKLSENKIIKLYKNGKTIEDIKDIFNTSQRKIKIILKNNNITIRKTTSYTKSFSQKQEKEIFSKLKYSSYKNLAKEYNCSISLIKSTARRQHNNFCIECGFSGKDFSHNGKDFIICNDCRDNISTSKKEIRKKNRNHKKLSNKEKIHRNISTRIRSRIKDKNFSILDVLDYSIKELMDYFEILFSHPNNLHNGKIWMNWDNYGNYRKENWDGNNPKTWTWQIDHIIPVKSFNFNSEKDDGFKRCWALENLRPLNAKLNVLDGVRNTKSNKPREY